VELQLQTSFHESEAGWGRGVSQPFTTQPVELNQTCVSLEAVQVRLHDYERLTGPLFLGPVLLFRLG